MSGNRNLVLDTSELAYVYYFALLMQLNLFNISLIRSSYLLRDSSHR